MRELAEFLVRKEAGRFGLAMSNMSKQAIILAFRAWWSSLTHR